MVGSETYHAGIVRTGIFSAWRRIALNIAQQKRLIVELTCRKLAAEWKKSHIGSLWLYLTPLLSTLVWILLHRAGLFRSGVTRVPYPLFALLSITMWQSFSGAFGVVSAALASNSSILMQNRVAPEAMALSNLLVHLFRITVSLVMVVGLLLIFTDIFTPAALLFPVAMLPLIIAGTALGLIFSLVKIVAIDLFTVFDKLVSFAMFVTPVIYAKQIQSPMLSSVTRWNPLSYLIDGPRDLLLNGSIDNFGIFAALSLASILFLLLAGRLFIVAAPWMYERVVR